MDLQERMRELDARIAARAAAINAKSEAAPEAEQMGARTSAPVHGASRQARVADSAAPGPDASRQARVADSPVPGPADGSVRTAIRVAKSALFGLPNSSRAGDRQPDVLPDGGGLVAPGALIYLCCIAFFLRGAHPAFLAAAAVLGILVMPIQSSSLFMLVGGTAFGISRFLCYALNGAALAAVLAGVFGFAYGSGGFVCSFGPVGKALVEEIAKALFLLGAFRLGGRKVREYSVVAGAAIGAGFMAFAAVETTMALQGGGSFFAFARHLPFGHVAATGILGAALAGLTSREACPMRKVSALLLALPLLIHILWAADIWIPWFIKYILFGFVLWSAAILLVVFQLVVHPNWLPSMFLVCGRADRGTSSSEARGPLASLVVFIIATFFTGFLLAAGGFIFHVIEPHLGL